jgi:hypothetical protein
MKNMYIEQDESTYLMLSGTKKYARKFIKSLYGTMIFFFIFVELIFSSDSKFVFHPFQVLHNKNVTCVIERKKKQFLTTIFILTQKTT